MDTWYHEKRTIPLMVLINAQIVIRNSSLEAHPSKRPCLCAHDAWHARRLIVLPMHHEKGDGISNRTWILKRVHAHV